MKLSMRWEGSTALFLRAGAHGGRRPRKGNREEVGHAVKGPKDLGRLGCGLLLGAEGAGWGGLLAEVRKRVS